jgi:hypothetical protein
MIHHVRMIKDDNLKLTRKDLSKHKENFSKSLISKIRALLSLTNNK